MSQILLTYHSSTLRQADITLFNSGNWLNDQCLLFYFEYLSTTSSSSLLFLDPGTSYLLLYENDLNDLAEALSQINLENRSLIFCAINDNNNPSSSGGSHWTLLVYSTIKNKGYYYDSLGFHRINYENSKDVLNKLSKLLSKTEPKLKIVEIKDPQSNSSDCGVYVLMLAEEISRNLSPNLKNQQNISKKNAKVLRSRILQLINSLIL